MNLWQRVFPTQAAQVPVSEYLGQTRVTRMTHHQPARNRTHRQILRCRLTPAVHSTACSVTQRTRWSGGPFGQIWFPPGGLALGARRLEDKATPGG